jgi:xylulose-5-phosphate/fructose-6-phosphate phosphoketolase
MDTTNPNSWIFACGPGHGFPALQANLWLDGEVRKIPADLSPATSCDNGSRHSEEPRNDGRDEACGGERVCRNLSGLTYICKNFSWPRGYPSHASPYTPGVILEGGELGYSLGVAYGAVLDAPHRKVATLIGDGEAETAALLASLNLIRLIGERDGHVLPILHRNGYKISGPTITGRMSDHELYQLFSGFGYAPIFVNGDDSEAFQGALKSASRRTFIIMTTPKGEGAPATLHGEKIAGNYLSHQVPLPAAKTDPDQLALLEQWLKSYHVTAAELFNEPTKPKGKK